MNDLQQLCAMIRARLPEAEIAIDEPESAAGTWWADVAHSGQRAVVEWRPGHGFGVSGTGGVYGEGPDAVAVTTGNALDRVLRILDANAPALAVRSRR